MLLSNGYDILYPGDLPGALGFFLLCAACVLLPVFGRRKQRIFSGGCLLHELAHVAILFVLRAPPALVQLTALGCRMVPNRERTLSYGQAALVSLGRAWRESPLCGRNVGRRGDSASVFLRQPGVGASSQPANRAPRRRLGPPFSALAASGARRAGRFATGVSLLFLFPMAVLGFLILLRTRYNFTLLAMSLYLMLYLLLGKDLSL